MVQNPFSISLTHKSPLFYRLFSYSAKPITNFSQRSQLSLNPVQISGLKACSYPIRCTDSRIEFKGFGCFDFRWPENAGRVCAGGGSGGAGGLGGSGNSGGGGEIDGGGETSGGSSGGIDWSFFSWIFTAAILYCSWDVIRQFVFEQASSADLKRTAFSGSMGLPLVDHTLRFWNLVEREISAFFDALLLGMTCISLFIVLLCIWILVVAFDFATRKSPKWGLESYIETLPKYKFCHDNRLRPIAGDNKRESLGDELGLIDTNPPDELSLLPDDSDCCICLSSYVEGVELNILPCKHHFHCECIGKWLRINATCPVCKCSILGDEIYWPN